MYAKGDRMYPPAEAVYMAQVELIHSMLKDCGAIQLINPNNAHPKFKLPSGDLFVMAATPSDWRSMQNALSELRRKVRPTHPEIANYGRSTPKAKVQSISAPSPRHITTKSRIVPFHRMPLQELQPAITAPLPSSAGFRPNPTSRVLEEPEYETLTYHPRSVHKKYENKNGMAKTLTNEQLAEANARLQLFGQASMDAYLNECRNSMMPASLAIRNNVPFATHSEDKYMSDILAAIRVELKAAATRVETYDERKKALDREFQGRKNALAAEKEQDEKRLTELQAYADEHETFLARQQAILKMLPLGALNGKGPKAKRVMPQRLPGAAPKGISGAMFVQKVLPYLKGIGLKEFTTQQVQDAAMPSGATDFRPEIGNVYPTLSGFVKKGVLARVEDGKYKIVETK